MIIQGMSYLTDPNNQFVLRNGSPNVAGIVRVYYAGTDDLAKTYCDFEGTRNPADIRLDNNGRAVVIADVTKAYRVEVRDSNGGLIWTVSPAYCIGGDGVVPVAVSVPLVGVEIKSSGATKRFGDDGFVKNNPSNNQPSLYLPELGWWLFNVRLFLRNETARDLVQHITLEWNWNAFISEGIPPATYTALYPPSMQTDVDFTTTFTRQYGASALVHKDLHPDNWLTVRPVVYGGAPLTDTEWAVVIDIFKVRDA